MPERFDVVVVGARCAGAPLATMLARDGVRVCLLDKDRFPSDTPSTHTIQPAGVAVLQRLGVLDSILAVAPPITRTRMVFDDGEAEIDDVVGMFGAPVLGARRTVLDEILVRAAADAGADVRATTTVTGLLRDPGGTRVAGVTTTRGDVRARLVVGADGTRSTVARLAGAAEHHRTPNGRVFMWDYFAGDPTGGQLWIAKLGDVAYLVTPSDNGLTLVAACPSIDRRDEVRADRDEVYEAGLRAWPQLHDALAGLTRGGPVRTMANMHGFFRESAGPGWALLGDAGHFKDPSPGQGIADALRQSERMHEAIVAGLGASGEELDRRLYDWWRWRDRDAWEMYWFAHDVGAAGPTPPLLRALQRRIAADPASTERVMRVFNHELAPSTVFPPRLALSTLGRELRHGRGDRRALLRDAADTGRAQLQRAWWRRSAIGRSA